MKVSQPVLAHQELSVTGGMVVAQHPLGARIGAEVLERGGNAVDAAVTTAFAMGVLQPLMNGVGGGGVMIVRHASGGTGALDFGMRAAAKARADMYELENQRDTPQAGDVRFSRQFAWPVVRGQANQRGHSSVAVPGTAAGMAVALENWGTMSLDQALAPAIRLAREGFKVGHHFTLALVAGRALLTRYPGTAPIFYPNGQPIPVGGRFVQADHARTLELIARNGPDGFYRGEVAQRIASDMAANGGAIREADLAAFKPTTYQEAIPGTYRGFDFFAMPGPNAGTTATEILNILDHLELSRHDWGSVRALHLVIEAIRRAAADRFTYLGDHPEARFDVLASREFAATRAATIDLKTAGPAVAGDPWKALGRRKPAGFPAPSGSSPDGGTTHITVVDKKRNAVGLTQTNMGYSGVVVPGVGVMMNNAMGWFYPGPGTVNSIVPGGRGLNNMTPMVLERNGKLHAVLGASGGRRIWTAVTQSIVNHVDFKMSLQAAMQAPRVHVETDDVLLDGRFGPDVRAGLEKLGHRVTLATPYFDRSPFSEPNGIMARGRTLRSAIYPVAKPTFAAGYPGDDGSGAEAMLDAGLELHP